MVLKTRAIVDADVRPSDEPDTADLTEKVLELEERSHDVIEDDKNKDRVELVPADKGYFEVEEVYLLQELGIETVISDPQRNRRTDDRLSEDDQGALETARGLVSSDASRGWMRKRNKLVERGFQHVLDSGGARRTTLRGRENIRKPSLIKAACANLSLLIRHHACVGTPTQALVRPQALLFALLRALRALFGLKAVRAGPDLTPRTARRPAPLPENRFSTEGRDSRLENGLVQRPVRRPNCWVFISSANADFLELATMGSPCRCPRDIRRHSTQ